MTLRVFKAKLMKTLRISKVRRLSALNMKYWLAISDNQLVALHDNDETRDLSWCGIEDGSCILVFLVGTWRMYTMLHWRSDLCGDRSLVVWCYAAKIFVSFDEGVEKTWNDCSHIVRRLAVSDWCIPKENKNLIGGCARLLLRNSMITTSCILFILHSIYIQHRDIAAYSTESTGSSTETRLEPTRDSGCID